MLLLLLMVGLLGSTPLRADVRVADSLVVVAPLANDLYALARTVQIQSALAGSAGLVAGTVQISGDVAGDISVLGGEVQLDGGVGDDLRIVAGKVYIQGFVTDQASIIGGSVTLGGDSAIGGPTWIAAATVNMAGQIGDNLRVIANRVVISGKVVGNVEILAREIRLLPGAFIGGNFLWRSPQPPTIAPGVDILGKIQGEPEQDSTGTDQGIVTDEAEHSDETDGLRSRDWDEGERDGIALLGSPLTDFAGGWVFGLALLLAAFVLLRRGPALVERSALVFWAAPGATVGQGAAALVLTPLCCLLLFFTVIGWLLALVVAAAYVLGLLLSGLMGLLIGVHWLCRRFGILMLPTEGARGWGALLLLLLVLVGWALMQQVPVLGTLLTALLVVGGFGALTTLVMGWLSGAAPDRPPAG